ncbi:hypothetical protein N0V93_004928 [Gnomoniopsis smithogilvyi]|uniref:SnoaL-like polyketide cyclase n=1 Tax=Gnomoniopsis smithogilvyi TaxID=1191159 RepID=A0A9W9CXM5_9PEZI|nr:hypothetical protein N0V93_004928 [Gnomoniopsis smithogilvyi]
MVNSTLQSILVPMIIDDISILNFDKDQFPEVEIDGEVFCIIAVRKDISILSNDGSALASDYAGRVHIDCFPKLTATLETNLKVRSTAAHVFITGFKSDGFSPNNTPNIKSSESIVDTDSLREAARATKPPTLLARNISHHVGNMNSDTLKQRYQAYIDAINGRKMSQTLHEFCHDVVIHNGKSLPLVEYRKLMEDAQALMPDLEFSIANSLVDADKQILAAKIDFLRTPIGELAEVTPLECVRKEVKYNEIVFYWFQDGKIAQVVSLVDLTGYRKQVTAQR